MTMQLFRYLLLALAVLTAGGEAWAEKIKCDFSSGTGKYAGKWDSGYFYYDTTTNTVEVERYRLFLKQTVKLNLNKYGRASVSENGNVLSFYCEKAKIEPSTNQMASNENYSVKNAMSDETICASAIITIDGAKDWVNNHKTYGGAFVAEAKRRGLSCGVLEAPAYPRANLSTRAAIELTNLQSVTDGDLCSYATMSIGMRKRWEFSRPGTKLFEVLEEVKRRALTCGVNEGFSLDTVLSTKSSRASIENRVEKLITQESDDRICNRATRNGIWEENGGPYNNYLVEAKRRGLTCGVGETASTQTASIPNSNQPKAPTSAALLAAEQKARELEQQLAALKAQQERQQQTISSDTQKPIIQITNTSSNGPQGTVRGRITDNTGVAEVRVDGQLVKVDGSGNFTFNTYVPDGGKAVKVEAIDLAGLSSSMTARLGREMASNSNVLVFDSLNPLKRRVAKNKNALALIIGLETYEKTDAKAAYADSDAKVFADYAALKLGIPQARIKTLLNDDADIADVLLSVQDWLSRAIKQGQSDVYIFFAGHGLASEDGEQMYLLPYDGSPRLLQRTALLRDELFSDIASANPRSVTVFLDTCYSGTTRGTDMLIASRPIAIKAIEKQIPKGFTVMTAAAGDQTAKPLEEAKHGMFSYFLMKGMEGLADSNQDNKITAGELHQYVQQNVMQQSSGSQTPELQGDADRVLVRFQ